MCPAIPNLNFSPGLWYEENGGASSSLHYKRFTLLIQSIFVSSTLNMGRRGCDGMVVGFTTTYAICAYYH